MSKGKKIILITLPPALALNAAFLYYSLRQSPSAFPPPSPIQAVPPAKVELSEAARKACKGHPSWKPQLCETFAKHPGWPANVRDAISHHLIFIGMTKEMVLAATEMTPAEAHRTVTATGTVEQMDYPGFGKILLENGRVAEIVQ